MKVDFPSYYEQRFLNLLNEEEINYIIANNKVDTNLISDKYHTFGELYEHRICLFIALCLFVDLYTEKRVWKSKLHHDGSSFDGWFIMGIDDRKGEQISYHLPNSFWDKAVAVELDKAPEFDGHTSANVLERLQELL